jgi:hypothetical protein
MFTLFWAGNEFAPETNVDGVPAQEFLQGHFLGAFGQLARRLRETSCVVGYEPMNEPSRGYIGWTNLRSAGQFRYWPTPGPYKGMLLGAGYPQRVWLKKVNPRGRRAWREGYDCIWKQNGVWDVDGRGRPHLLHPDYFTRVNPEGFGFRRVYYPRFAKRFAEMIREIDPRALIFVQGEPGERAPALSCEELPNMVYAPHWYDGITLIVRRYVHHIGVDMLERRFVLGADAIQQSFAAQLAFFRKEAEDVLGGVPVLLGEFGIPFDLHNKPLWRAADELLTTRALDRSFRALEKNAMSGTIWNYTADNTHGRGDSFNGEDLSIYSMSEQKEGDPDAGARALGAVVRPYPRAIAGEPTKLHYDWLTRKFEFEFRHDAGITAATEIFVPRHSYREGFEVEVSDGRYELCERTLTYYHDAGKEEHRVVIKAR